MGPVLEITIWPAFFYSPIKIQIKVSQKDESKICSWCGDPVLDSQPKSQANDGEIMHFGCACQADDADIGDCSNG